MADQTQGINAFIQTVIQRVTSKSTVNSISPSDVGGSITDLASFLLPILNTINNFNILGGELPPLNADGVNDDIYIQGGTSIVFYKKSDGVWVNKVTVPLGINIVDGNISVQTSISGLTVTSTAGQWGINNTIRQSATQTQFTVPTQDANFDRIDAVFGKEDNTLHYVAGTASTNPDGTKPATPPNEVVISYIYVPSIASGQIPYVVNSTSNTGGGETNKVVVIGNQSHVTAINEDLGVLPVSFLNPTTPFIASYQIIGQDTVYISNTMLQNGFLYGFPNPENFSFSYTITYIN